MGRIIASVTLDSVFDPSKTLRCDTLVDTGSSHLALPTAWKDRMGDLQLIRTVELETATQATVQGEVYGPVRVQVEGFEPVFSEVLFVEMEPEDGLYEPLLGYIILEQCQATVDMLGHRLVHVKRLDLR